METQRLLKIPAYDTSDGSDFADEVTASVRGPRASTSPNSTLKPRILVPSPAAGQYGYNAGRYFDIKAVMQSTAAIRDHRETVVGLNRRRIDNLPDGIRATWEEKYSLIPGASAKQAYPWRARMSDKTGLPWLYRGITTTAPDANNAIQVASDWLDKYQAQLMGLEAGVQGLWKKQFPRDPELTISRPTKGTQRYHVTYQQFHDNIPVYQAKVSVKLAENNPRASVISSYFANIRVDTTPKLKPEQALEIVRGVLPHYLQEQKPPARSNLLRLIDLFDVFNLFKIVAPRKPDTSHWRITINTHYEYSLLIAPFAGDYHLAYEVLVEHQQYPESWSFFVDAHSGDLLGHPHALSFFSAGTGRYFSCSAAVTPPHEPDRNLEPFDGNPCEGFMNFKIVQNNGEQRLPDWSSLDPASADGAIINLAIHSSKFYAHIHSYLEYVSHQQENNIELSVSQQAAHDFFAVFAPQADGKLTITIALGNNNHSPLGGEQGTAENLARDPEILYHELSHALMWRSKKDPFGNPLGGEPFGRALVEGYANYLARSFGDFNTPADYSRDDRVPFAHSVYAEDTWDRWRLLRNGSQPGADLLAVPNHYPLQQLGNPLHEYDTGMILARCLWAIRQLFGHKVADGLALEISLFAVGYIQNFEVLEEALVDEGLKSVELHHVTNVFRSLFAERGIIVNQGVNTIYHSPESSWHLGTDTGLHFKKQSGWDSTESTEEVLHLFGINTDTYLLSKNQFRRFSTSGNDQDTIETSNIEGHFITACGYSRVADDGSGDEAAHCFIVTSKGLYHKMPDQQAALQGWKHTPLPTTDLFWTPIAIAVDSQQSHLYMITANTISRIALDDNGCVANAAWLKFNIDIIEADAFPVKCLSITDARVLIGTQKGILEARFMQGSNNRPWLQLNLLPGGVSRAVSLLCPTAEGELMACSRNALFNVSLVTGDVTPITDIPIDPASISTMAYAALPSGRHQLLIGTYTQGVWQYTYSSAPLEGEWEPIADLDNHTGNNIPVLVDQLSLTIAEEGYHFIMFKSADKHTLSVSSQISGGNNTPEALNAFNRLEIKLWDISRACSEVSINANHYSIKRGNNYCLVCHAPVKPVADAPLFITLSIQP